MDDKKMIDRKEIVKKEETIWCIKIIVMLIMLCSLSYMNAHDMHPINSMKNTGIWGDTWECKRCGYENYEMINKCSVCGTKKGHEW
jgi:rubrerythrin